MPEKLKDFELAPFEYWVTPDMPEDMFQSRLIVLTEHSKIAWKIQHSKKTKQIRGDRIFHSTPVINPGFPDLVLATQGRTIFSELKSANGRVDPDQRIWLDLLASNSLNEVYVWKPIHWQIIVNIIIFNERVPRHDQNHPPEGFGIWNPSKKR